MARTFNPPPNWPKPPEGWEPPPGWQPDPAWGPAPEGWQVWLDDEQAPADSAGSATSTTEGAEAASGAAAADGSPSAPSFGDQGAGTGTSRMPKHQSAAEEPTAQSTVHGSETTRRDSGAGHVAAGAAGQHTPQGSAPQYQAAGSSGFPPSTGGPGGPGGPGSPGGPGNGKNGGSKLPWILGAVIILLVVVMLILVLALTGVFRGSDSETTGGEETQSQTQAQTPDGGDEVTPGGMATAEATQGASDDPSVSEEATRINVDPEGATEIGDLGDPVETFTQEDGEFELPRPDGDDAPQLISVENTGDGFLSFEAERADGSDAFISGATRGEPNVQLESTYSFDRGNPITKVRSEDEGAEFELKVYSLDALQKVEGGSIKGDGNAAFLVDVKDGSTWYKMSHNGTSNFIVYAATDYEDGTYGDQELAANEIGRTALYTEYGEGLWLVSVEADGKWGFEETTEQMARDAAVAEIMNDN
ncbi:hypothetical protein FCK90_12870 [Kocuria coralli]|uniref:Uncharacterized protein n=1 Tax=Kocuria coralli TaxID=1461025 RepID=A0A5J5KWJ7_9MICC|nr:hypothetical protein [Kocuria coralli]KAA9393275.1 hypothetical protein FCK90_12870 [Kocuria coralli]